MHNGRAADSDAGSPVGQATHLGSAWRERLLFRQVPSALMTWFQFVFILCGHGCSGVQRLVVGRGPNRAFHAM